MSQKIDSSFQHINKLLVHFFIYKIQRESKDFDNTKTLLFIITDLIY